MVQGVPVLYREIVSQGGGPETPWLVIFLEEGYPKAKPTPCQRRTSGGDNFE